MTIEFSQVKTFKVAEDKKEQTGEGRVKMNGEERYSRKKVEMDDGMIVWVATWLMIVVCVGSISLLWSCHFSYELQFDEKVLVITCESYPSIGQFLVSFGNHDFSLFTT